MNEFLDDKQQLLRRIQNLSVHQQEEMLNFIDFLEEGHSLIQGHLCEIINRFYLPVKIARAFLEVSCRFAGKTIIPDLAVFRCDRIPSISSGKIPRNFDIYPNWSIEILSLKQNPIIPLRNLLHCSQSGTELGWLIDPLEETVLIVFPEQRVQLLQANDKLPVLSGIDLDLTVSQVLDWSFIDY